MLQRKIHQSSNGQWSITIPQQIVKDLEIEHGEQLVQIACETYIASNMTQKEVADIFEISASQISQNY